MATRTTAMMGARSCLDLHSAELDRLEFDMTRIRKWAADIRSLTAPASSEGKK